MSSSAETDFKRKIMNIFAYKTISNLSVAIGGISLIAFLIFVIGGPFNIIDLNLDSVETILANTFLSVLFFLQHSLMIRSSVRKRVVNIIPKESFYAFFSIVSGATLFMVVTLWQESAEIILSIPAPYAYLLRGLQLIAILGLIWSVKSLKHFDIFGRREIARHINNKHDEQEIEIVYNGPYNLIRHPFYFFILLMIWAYPMITADRLLFICIWTAWIVIGTLLEERDLTNQIGNDYREYKTKVPMLIPYKFPTLQK
jgi:protein-S-isoprenylcysteine O-methyltransferase Ste14